MSVKAESLRNGGYLGDSWAEGNTACLVAVRESFPGNVSDEVYDEALQRSKDL
jgi:hypothetical protein